MVPADQFSQPGEPVLCAGAVVRDGAGRLLLIQRGQPPAAGTWTLPGGRVEPGESPAAAAAREVAEETGLTVEVGALLAVVPVLGYLVHDFAATVVGGELTPGDDAADARWFALGDLATLELSPGLLDALAGMGVT
ncbi:MAG TPA: NUDIX domain-containing protein [Mycobacteriales bacterium]|nr:NUDIX domain-containing protein [Mycobacteriales bacterium]